MNSETVQIPAAGGIAAGGLRSVSDRVDELVGALSRRGAKDLQGKVEDAVRLLMELYGAGVAQALEFVAQGGERAVPVLANIRKDPLLADLISLHGIAFHQGASNGAAHDAPAAGGDGGGRTATGGRNLRAVGDRIEELVREFSELEPGEPKDHAQEVVRLMVDLYGTALEQVMRIVDEGGEEVWDLIDRFSEDELLKTLMIVHGLHPSDLEARIMGALEKVRPYLNSHGGNVEVVGLDEAGVLTLRLQGSCQGCPSSTLTLKLAIERAIREAAPEISKVRAEGLEEEAETPHPKANGGLLQIQKRKEPKKAPAADAWADLDAETAGVAAGKVAQLEVDGARIMVCRVGETLYAYRDSCPGCSAAVGGGVLMGSAIVCPGCQRTYDVRLAGRGLDKDADGLHLDPIPLLAEDGSVRVAIGAAR